MEQDDSSKLLNPIFDVIFQVIVFIILAIYSYGFFVIPPYIGFSLGADRVLTVYQPGIYHEAFEDGVPLLKINDIEIEAFQKDFSQTLFDDPLADEKISIDFLPLGGTEADAIHIEAPILGFTYTELFQRIFSTTGYAWFFWVIGLFVFALMRPKNMRWRMLIVFLGLFTIFLVSGTIASHHLLGGKAMLRLVAFLFFPVSLHLHLIFPVNLFEVSEKTKKIVMPNVYALFGVLGLLSMSSPSQNYSYIFLLGLLGSALLLVAQFIRRPASRKKLGLFFAVQFLTAVLFIFIAMLVRDENMSLGFALFVVPMIPLGYVYAIYRRQLADIQFRKNPIIILYLFGMLLVLLVFFSLNLLNTLGVLPLDELTTTKVFLFSTVMAVLATAFYAPFLNFVEKYVFGIHLPSDALLHKFNRRLNLVSNPNELVNLIQEGILPSMYIRESGLIVYENKEANLIYMDGVDAVSAQAVAESFPPESTLTDWQFAAERPLGWVRLAIPLLVEEKKIGLWLFGEHDPDDYYPEKEIRVLETLATPIAISLQNMHQARQLRTMNQVNENRLEQQRLAFGQDLHDGALNELSKLVVGVEDAASADQLTEIIKMLRNLIEGARPPIFDYGLRFALVEFTDTLSKSINYKVNLKCELEQSNIRYAEAAEAQIFRIIAQAVENALRHASAENIIISGDLSPEGVNLRVEDDGVGFEFDRTLNFRSYLNEKGKRFGLAGMAERADFIRATLDLDSSVGQGTCIALHWRPEDLREEDI